MTNRLQNKIAIVTGATSGIGRSTAKLFAAEGESVHITGRRKVAVDKAVAKIGNSAIDVQAKSANSLNLDKVTREGEIAPRPPGHPPCQCRQRQHAASRPNHRSTYWWTMP
jgi:NAD(P)-dependent dehydrogenase (short-subunit alcohol dehydrogenase family)